MFNHLVGPSVNVRVLKSRKGDRRGSREEMECWKQTETRSVAGDPGVRMGAATEKC